MENFHKDNAVKFINSKYFQHYVNDFNLIFAYISGGYLITNEHHDVDVSMICDYDFEAQDEIGICNQYFFKRDNIDNYTHIDVMLKSSSKLVDTSNRIEAGIQKSFFDLDQRMLWFNPKYKNTKTLLYNREFLKKIQLISFYGLYNILAMSMIKFINEDDYLRIAVKEFYSLYYCYCKLNKKLVNADLLSKLRRIKFIEGYPEDIKNIFKEMLDFGNTNPINVIDLEQEINLMFYNAVKEDRRELWQNS